MTNQVVRISILLLMTAVLGRAQLSVVGSRRPFTVRDSIEMTTISDPYTRLPDAECKRSPDGKHFLVVTTRGVLRTNQLVSLLWVYSAADVSRYLHEQDGQPLKPRLLLRIAGTPVAQQDNSYGSLITKAQWSSDSQSILSLAEQSNGHRHLFRTNLSGGISADLTSGNADVKNFSEAHGTIAYLVVEQMSPPIVLGKPIDKASSDLSGLSLFHILFPKKFPDPSSFWPALDLWVRYKGVNREVNAGEKWHFPSSAAGLQISVAPDGRSFVAARPVLDIPAEWSHYKTADNISGFSQAHTGTDRSGKGFNWPWQYVYIELDKMTVTPLVDAPAGFLEGYMDSLSAEWSADSQSVLFTNTYLPLPKRLDTKRAEQTGACAVALYTVATEAVTCIANARFPESTEYLWSAAFHSSSDEVILDWSGESTNKTEIYEKIRQGWRIKNPQKVTDNEAPSKLRIFLKQDINEAPTLWAAESEGSVAKELWNFNPQLASFQLGDASVYTWKDSTGYVWHAGLLLPPNFVRGHRYPLVIQTHGFYNQHEFLVDGSFTTGFAARPLAVSGIIVLQMEDRADRHVLPAEQEAILTAQGFKSAINHLDKDGLIDPSHVGIIGFSRAAWYVEEALIQAPPLFCAATLIDGVDQSYMTYMLFAPGNPEASVEQEAANGGKPFGAGLENWVKNAATFNLSKVRTPVRIEALGESSILEEWEIYSSLYQQGKPVDLIDIPNGQHILQSPQERYSSQQGNVDWFRFWLQGYEDTIPQKREQYTRWEHWSK
jgi:hypothetical protein